MSRDNRERFDDADQAEYSSADDLSAKQLRRAADTLRVLAHPHRLQMLSRLRQASRTVSWLAEDCGIRRHTASEHLRLMQKLDFVKSQRRGRFTYYRLNGLAGRQLIEVVESWSGEPPEYGDR